MKVITLRPGVRYIPVLSIFKYVSGAFAAERHYRMTFQQVGKDRVKHLRFDIGSNDLAKVVGAYVIGFIPFWDVIEKRVVYADEDVFDEVIRYSGEAADVVVSTVNEQGRGVRVSVKPTGKGLSVELSANPVVVMGGKLFFAVDNPEKYIVDNVVIMRAVKVGLIINSRTGKKTRIFVGVPT